MNTMTTFKEIFDLLSQPIFFVREQTIEYSNFAASRRMIREGDALEKYLDDVSSACVEGDQPVHLLLKVAGQSCWATTRPFEDGLLFALEDDGAEDTQPEMLLPMASAVIGPLNQIMTSARGLSALMQDTEDAAFRKNTVSLTKSCYRLMRFSKNLSAVRDALTDEAVVIRKEGDLRAFIDDLYQKVRPLLEKADLTLTCSLPDEPLMAWFDAIRLRRAILNLLDNSAKFTPAGGEIALNLDLLPNYARISVKDNGRGFDPDVLASAFRRYTRHVGMEEFEWGPGFGLPIVRSIVENHSGTVMIRSAKGRGAAVMMTVKLGIPPADQTTETPMSRFDYTGGVDAALLELSDALPNECYD